MDVKKFMILAVAAVLLFFVITQPAAAANMVHNVLDMLMYLATQIVKFLDNVF